ncbi:hypothetical protein OFK41_07910 [Acinetobacter baumannii]|uniref:hypothetical protein n=1 Tax=Acinetobacter baumannii TaxID=470 RepID=UPI00225B3835|nr:hypothetical protein [Acinetobacter baumannii]MCX3034132.1 hypothetical protein [Acinetobacter baumannii]
MLKFITLVLSISTALLFTACSSENTPKQSTPKTSDSDVVAQAIEAANEEIEKQKAQEKANNEKSEDKAKVEKEVDPYKDVRHMLEKDADLDSRLTEKNILGVVGLIVGNGYKCDTVSAITPFPRKTGYYVMCNQYHYDYEVEDKGGNWTVTLN